MLEQSWEGYATVLANTPNEELGKAYESLVNETLVDEIRQLQNRPANIVIGRDTRASGPTLVKALKAALDAVGATYKDYGHLTTPQLHYMVRCVNTQNTPYAFGEATEEGYYKKMANAFKTIVHGRKIQGPVTVDCANGVGGPKLRELIKYLPTSADDGIDIVVVNDDVLKPEALNFEVRASRSNWGLILTISSAAPTTSKLDKKRLQVPKPGLMRDAAHWMATLTASSTTTPMKITRFTYWTATELLHWVLSSSLRWRRRLA